MWAQRNPIVYVTFKVESCNNPKVVFENNKVTFTGEDHYSKTRYCNVLEVYEEIKPEVNIFHNAFVVIYKFEIDFYVF